MIICLAFTWLAGRRAAREEAHIPAVEYIVYGNLAASFRINGELSFGTHWFLLHKLLKLYESSRVQGSRFCLFAEGS